MSATIFNLDNLIRDNVKKIKPYSSARDEYTGTANVFLDANENPLGSVGGEKRNRYPDPRQWALKKALSGVKGVAPEKMFLGNGSDEAIDLVFRAFCEPRIDNVITMPPTYGMYQVSAELNDVQVVEVPLKEGFEIDVSSVLASVNANTKLIFICSPNNPSGNALAEEAIKEILGHFNGIVVIDEAYADFCDKPPWAGRIDEYPNLIAMQTFSKAWGLANIRLGMAFASPEIITVFNRIKPPYNVNGLTQELAAKALQNKEQRDGMVQVLKDERAKLAAQLPEFNFITKVYPSDANYLLVKTTAPKEIYNHLVAHNVVVRDRSSQYLCEGCLRITVGTKEENEVLLKALKNFSI